MVNDPDITSTAGKVYYPRARVLWGDGGWTTPEVVPTIELPWLLSVQVQKTLWHTSDRFQCTFALFGDENYSYQFWAKRPKMIVSVEVAFDEATPQGRVVYRPWTPLIRGFVQTIKQDVIKGVVTIDGIDIGGTFSARHENSSDQEKTVRDKVQEICDNAHIEVVIDEEFNVIHGSEYNNEKTHQTTGVNSGEITGKDALTKLADHYGATHFVDEQGVYHFLFKPVGETWTINAPTPIFLGGASRHQPSNFTELSFEHYLMFSEHEPSIIAVNINTQKKTGERHVIGVGTEIAPVLMDVSQHSPEDAKKIASNHLKSYIGKEWTFDMVTSDPTWIDFKAIDLITVKGTNSDNDGPYRLDSIEYQLDAKRGFSVNVKGAVGRDIAGEVIPAGGEADPTGGAPT